MKTCRSNQSRHAMTLVEVLVVIFALAILVAMILPQLAAAKRRSGPTCVNWLHQIGLAYKSWAGDNNDKYPMEVSIKDGGTMELVAGGKNAWLNYLVMSNELSSPKVLICFKDFARFPPATSFSTELVGKISYFVGLDATCTGNPQAILSGDDNFEINGVPVKSGMLKLTNNHATAWTAARHRFNGNIGLADGSAQQLSNSGLTNLLQQTGLATNRIAIP